MGRLIEETKVLEVMKTHWLSGTIAHHIIDDIRVDIIKYVPTVEAIPKADYENRLKADMVAMLTEIQLEFKELWDNRYDVWLDNQYYIGKSDTLEEVDEVIQQKINSLKEQNE